MALLTIPEPVSAGIILSCRCTNACRHCMYACSPRRSNDWMNRNDAERNLKQLSEILARTAPEGLNEIGLNSGVHFTGGEPFLNYDLLLEITRIAGNLNLPWTFVETNCFWCVNDEKTEERLLQLREAGLKGILISANPFVVEQTPFERIERAVKIGVEVFGDKVMVYQGSFFNQLKRLRVKGTLPFSEYLRLMTDKDPVGLHEGLSYPSILPMGRAPFQLGDLYRKYPAHLFFQESCRHELTRDWHVHIDNYRNYTTGYCAGISLGDAKDIHAICQGVELDDHPIIQSLVSPRGLERLFRFGVEEYGYEQIAEGYVSKCHLCIDIRKTIVKQTDGYRELKPAEFYRAL